MDLSNRTNTTRLSPRSSDNEFDGSNFSNNLFSDLAPLLTLFGEQVTKQFLSQAVSRAFFARLKLMSPASGNGVTPHRWDMQTTSFWRWPPWGF